MGYGMYTNSQSHWDPPHKNLSPRLFWVVEAALREAWKILISDKSTTAKWRTAKEDELTLDLFEALKDTIWQEKLIPGFDNQIFSTINREPNVRNYNGKHPDKMPDLLIEFVDIPSNIRASQFGIFIECKPVDTAHSVGTHYCKKGIIRFINGDYAWSMRDAVMLAYSSGSYHINRKLLPHLLPSNSSKFASSQEPICCSQSKEDSIAEQTLISTHPRNFKYLENDCPAPTITLRHIWFKR